MTALRTSSLESAVWDVLELVMDPCSVAAGRPVSIVAMGLVTEVSAAEGRVSVVLRTTFPGCTMAPKFAEAAEEQVGSMPGVREVEVSIDPAFTWTPEQARPEARGVPLPTPRSVPGVVPWARRQG